jgi:hypothetical protein
MNTKDKVEVLRKQVNALLSIEREVMQERQVQLENDGKGDDAVERGKPPVSERQRFSIFDQDHRRHGGTGTDRN